MLPRPEDANARASAQVALLEEALLAWYAACRRDLPWRKTRDPYAIWISEIMLQQTRVETVVPYWERFLSRFPTVKRLAEADEGDVLASWSGLGYYRRARLLHAGARAVAAQGAVPKTRDALLDVPGIGPYTAGAIASIAFGEAVGLVDGNVARVLARLFAIDDDMRKPAGLRRAQALADAIVAKRDPGAWNQALMELGATVCKPQAPSCETCPAQNLCRARAEGRERELPVLAPKAAPRPRRVQCLVATRRGAVLLARRTHDSLFAGLWEPPSIEGAARARTELLASFPIAEAKHVGRVEHVLSHRKLTVDVLRAELTARVDAALSGYDAFRLVRSLDDLGIATLTRKILRKAGL
jgi:A/G-specific adenine glycosylase